MLSDTESDYIGTFMVLILSIWRPDIIMELRPVRPPLDLMVFIYATRMARRFYFDQMV